VGLNSEDLAIVEGELKEVQELKASSSILGFRLTWFFNVVCLCCLMQIIDAAMGSLKGSVPSSMI